MMRVDIIGQQNQMVWEPVIQVWRSLNDSSVIRNLVSTSLINF